jgi:hypothetical protein
MKRGRVVALVVVIVVAIAFARCHPGNPADTLVYCGVSALPPDQAGDDNHFAAHGHYRCDNPGADVLQVTVNLEKRGAGNAWVVVASRAVTVKGTATTKARTDKQRSIDSTGFECQEGTFRTTVVAVEQSHGKQKTITAHSPSIKHACV